MAVETKVRKFLNDPALVVKESLAGLAAAHPDLLRYDAQQQIVVRKGAPKPGKVALVSGGGSGHEPLHGGFVGLGMLDAACPGEVFTSPVPDQMLAATKRDAVGAEDPLPALRHAAETLGLRTVPVSAVTGEGLAELKQQLAGLIDAGRPAAALLGQR